MADSDFALFNDILDDIATKKQEDEDEAFFGVKIDKNIDKSNENDKNDIGKPDNSIHNKKKEHHTVQFASSPILSRTVETEKENTEDKNNDNDIKSYLSTEYQDEKSDAELPNKNNNDQAGTKTISKQDSQSSIDEEIMKENDKISESENKNNVADEQSNSDENDSQSESESKNENKAEDEMTSYRESSDSVSNIDLESYRQNERKEIKTVSFSMQYDKFCNVLNRIETGMNGGSVSFDVDAITNENKLLVSPKTDQDTQFQTLADQPPVPNKRKKRKVKKKRKKTPSVNNDIKEKANDEQRCFCRSCKLSIYNQPNMMPLNQMFKSNSQPPTPPTPMVKKTVRPKTTSAIKSTKRQEAKMIDLDFSSQRQRTTSKLDADLKKSGNPVLIAWLKVKNDEERERKRREKKELKKQEKLAQDKLLKMRQRSFAATERVQEWINRKRVQSVESRKPISPESYKSVPSEPFDYSDEKFESGFSSDDEKGVSLPQLFPNNRPKTSRGPQNRQQQRNQKANLISISPAGNNLKQNKNFVHSPKEEIIQSHTDDSGFTHDENASQSSKDFTNERKEEYSGSSSESESEKEVEKDIDDETDSSETDSDRDSKFKDDKDNDDTEENIKPNQEPEQEAFNQQENPYSNANAPERKPEEKSGKDSEEKTGNSAENSDKENPKKLKENPTSAADNPAYVTLNGEDVSEAKHVIGKDSAKVDKVIEEKLEVKNEYQVETTEIQNEIKYILNIHDTQIKFDSLRDFTDLLIHDAIEEIEINSRLKQKRLRKPIGKSKKDLEYGQMVPAPPRTKKQSEETKNVDQRKSSKESSFNSVQDMVNFEKVLVNGNSPKSTDKSPEKTQETQIPAENTKKNVVSHEEWMSQKKKEIKEKKKKEKALNNFYHELEMKIVQEEKIRRVMEKEASKKRVDSGMPNKKSPTHFETSNNSAFSQKYNVLSQQENLLKYGRGNDFS